MEDRGSVSLTESPLWVSALDSWGSSFSLLLHPWLLAASLLPACHYASLHPRGPYQSPSCSHGCPSYLSLVFAGLSPQSSHLFLTGLQDTT